MKQLRAESWTTHAKTSVVMDDETTITGKRVVAECDSEEMATLFAAAPELLDALRIAAITIEHRLGKCHELENARSAIAKATGG